MADDKHGAALLEDGEFWLPPQFLCDEEPSLEERTFPIKFGGAAVGGFFTPAEYGTGWKTSNLSSPGESVVGSAEESDDEDFIADLTRKIAQYTLVDGFPPLRSSKGLFSSSSPKSTLCDGCGYGCGQSLLCGNPSGAVQLKSPQPETLDLLYQAAGKVANMRINQQRQQIERVQYLQQQLQKQQQRQQNERVQYLQQQLQKQQQRQQNERVQYLQQQQQRLNHLVHPCQVSSQQRLKFQPPQASGSDGAKFAKGETMLSSSAWPTLQQARQTLREPVSACVNGHGTDMRAVFPGSNNVYHRGSAGTGVFLPRRSGSDPEPKRKQQGCSTVLIPAKVVQALNVNLDKMGSQPLVHPLFHGRFTSENDGAWRIRSGRQVTPQPIGSHHLLQAAVSQEISLPHEWTY